MSFILQIIPQQRPFGTGKDAAGFEMCMFNVLVTRRYNTADLDRELAAVFQAAGVGTFETDIFTSSAAAVPPNCSGPYLTVVETAGLLPTKTQEETAPNFETLGAQIVVRAKHDQGRTPVGAWPAARTMAMAAYAACFPVVNQTVTAV